MKTYVPYVGGSSTSREAADSKTTTAKTDQERVFELIEGRGNEGATDDEVEVALGMLHQNASARRRGLVLSSRVVDSGRTRSTRTGRMATVWVAAYEEEEQV